MKEHYVLDSSVLVTDPGLLAGTAGDRQVWVPEPVLDGFKGTSPNSQLGVLLGILAQANAKGLFKTLPRATLTVQDAAGLGTLDTTDTLVLSAVLDLVQSLPLEEREHVYLVTDDKYLAKVSNVSGIRSLTAGEMRSRIPPDVRDGQITIAARKYTRSIRLSLLGGIGIGVFLTLTAYGATRWFVLVRDGLELWAFLAMGLLGGPFLFFIRCRMRLAYGIAEAGIGLMGVFMVYGLPSGYTTSTVYQLAGSLYVVVRGLDNVDRAIEKTPAAYVWNWIFKGSVR